MLHLGLDHHDFNAYLRTLITPGHQRKIEMHLLDLADGRLRRSLSPKFLDAQVVYDVTAEVSRMFDGNFADDQRGLGFVPDDPSDAPVHRSRMMRVFDCRYVDELGDWIECPVFTGPIIDFERSGGDVAVTCHSMEAQAMGAVWDHLHFPAKSKVTDAIRDLLAAAGDVNAVVPDLPHHLPHDVHIHPDDKVWPHVKHLAKSLDRHPFYDGMGRFKMPNPSQKHVYRFHKALTNTVTVRRNTDGFVNTVVVLGPKPKKGKKRIRAVATLKGSLSPSSLNRHGVGYREPLVVTREHLDSHKHAQKIADRLLLEHATTRTDLSFPVVPIPVFEEYDMAAVTDDSFGTERLRMRQWNLPLEGGDAGGSDGESMTVGTIRRTKKARLRR
jgi:hypothetical protein